MGLQAATLPSNSIYHLKSDWTRHDGKVVRLQSLSGTPRITAMVYLSCKFSCPILVSELKTIEAQLKKKNKVADFVLISIDPKSDTPDVMRREMEKRGLDPAHWTLLTSTEENIREVSNVLGVSYKRTSPTDFAHAFIITILDEAGVVHYQQSGTGKEPAELLKSLESLSKNPAVPLNQSK